MIILHIIIALLSLAVATKLIVSPSQRTVLASFALIGGTILSGITLVIVQPDAMLHACVSGIVYTSIITALSIVAARKTTSSLA